MNENLEEKTGIAPSEFPGSLVSSRDSKDPKTGEPSTDEFSKAVARLLESSIDSRAELFTFFREQNDRFNEQLLVLQRHQEDTLRMQMSDMQEVLRLQSHEMRDAFHSSTQAITGLLGNAVSSYNESIRIKEMESKRLMMRDQQEFESRKALLEDARSRYFEALHLERYKFIRIFWLSAISIFIISAICIGLIFVSKDVDKGLHLLAQTVIGLLAFLAGRNAFKARQASEKKPEK